MDLTGGRLLTGLVYYQGGYPSVAGSVIKHIEQGTITISSGVTTGSWAPAASYAFDPTKTMIIYGGVSQPVAASQGGKISVRLNKNSSVQIGATRNVGTLTPVTANFTIVEFSTGVNSIQEGTITVSTVTTTNTSTIATVSTNAFLLHSGSAIATLGINIGRNNCAISLASTVVTAHTMPLVDPITVGYQVVDLTSQIVLGSQGVSLTAATSSTVDTITIAGVTTARSMVFNNGSVPTTDNFNQASWGTQLQTSNSVGMIRNSTAAVATRTHYISVVEFSTAVLSQNMVQRGVINNASAASSVRSTTIAQVNTSLAFVNYLGVRCGAGNDDVSYPTITLASTSVTANTPSAATTLNNVYYEVVEFV